jgi:sugar phosphate isomerase/epimerase
MLPVAFNDFGFSHLDDRPPPDAGIAGWVYKAHELGFPAFQHSPGGVRPHTYFSELDLAATAQAVAETGVSVGLHHHAFDLCSYPRYAANDRDYIEEFEAFLLAAGDWVKALGGHLVTFHPPQLNRRYWREYGHYDPDDVRSAICHFGDTVRRLGDHGAKIGVRYAIEAICFPLPYCGGTAFRNPEMFDDFVRQPDFPETVGVQVDLTHYHFCGLDLGGWLRRWGDILWDVHTSDARFLEWQGEEHYLAESLEYVHLPLGAGTIDFTAVATALREVGYDGYWTLELYPQHVSSVDDHLQAVAALAAADATAAAGVCASS